MDSGGWVLLWVEIVLIFVLILGGMVAFGVVILG